MRCHSVCRQMSLGVPSDVIRCAAKILKLKLKVKTLPKNIKHMFLSYIFAVFL